VIAEIIEWLGGPFEDQFTKKAVKNL